MLYRRRHDPCHLVAAKFTWILDPSYVAPAVVEYHTVCTVHTRPGRKLHNITSEELLRWWILRNVPQRFMRSSSESFLQGWLTREDTRLPNDGSKKRQILQKPKRTPPSTISRRNPCSSPTKLMDHDASSHGLPSTTQENCVELISINSEKRVPPRTSRAINHNMPHLTRRTKPRFQRHVVISPRNNNTTTSKQSSAEPRSRGKSIRCRLYPQHENQNLVQEEAEPMSSGKKTLLCTTHKPASRVPWVSAFRGSQRPVDRHLHTSKAPGKAPPNKLTFQARTQDLYRHTSRNL